MELSQYIEMLRGELTALTRFAGEDVQEIAGLLAESLDSPVRLTLLDVLSTAAAEITARLDETVVEVRLSDGEPAFMVSTALPRDPGPPPGPEPAESAGGHRHHEGHAPAVGIAQRGDRGRRGQ